MPAAIDWTPELVEEQIKFSRTLMMVRLPQESCDCSTLQTFHRLDCQYAKDARARLENEFRREKLGERVE